MKKNLLKGILAALVAASLVFGLAACGGDSPKSLAKQNYEAFVKARDGEGAQKDAALKKVQELTEKADKLSGSDRKIYEEEFSKLLSGN